jgi:hypothetical protein
MTKAEKDVVAAVVADSPREVSEKQVTALATALRRPKAAIKAAIDNAQGDFQAAAGRYVEIHMEAIESALRDEDVKGREIAMKGAQWAIERLAHEGSRVIEKAAAGPSESGPRIQIGIRLGGIDATNESKAIEATVIEVKD